MSRELCLILLLRLTGAFPDLECSTSSDPIGDLLTEFVDEDLEPWKLSRGTCSHCIEHNGEESACAKCENTCGVTGAHLYKLQAFVNEKKTVMVNTPCTDHMHRLSHICCDIAGDQDE